MQQAHVFCSQASADPLFGFLGLGCGAHVWGGGEGEAVERWESDIFLIFKGRGDEERMLQTEPHASQEASAQLGRRSASTGHKVRLQQQSHPVSTG